MTYMARTPEDLDTLFEDASVLGDATLLRQLFCDHAVMAATGGGPDTVGIDSIASLVVARWRSGQTYFAGGSRVLQWRDTALAVGHGINVSHRSADGVWRYAISLPEFDAPQGGATHD